MKTYDELYDDIKRALDEGMELGGDDWKNGAYFAYRYVLDRLETRQEYATQLFATYEEIVKMQNELLDR